MLGEKYYLRCDVCLGWYSSYRPLACSGIFLKNLLNALFGIAATHELLPYLSYLNLYIVTIFVFAYIGIYTKRYDFWHESLLIFKGLLFSMVLLFFLMVVGKESTYSRVIIIFAFMIATIIIPPLKLILKRALFSFGLWARRAKIISKDKKFKKRFLKTSILVMFQLEKMTMRHFL